MYNMGEWMYKTDEWCIMMTNGYITWVNGCITTNEWMHGHWDVCIHKYILIYLLLKVIPLTLEHILRIGPFNSSGEEKQSCPCLSISVLKKNIYK